MVVPQAIQREDLHVGSHVKLRALLKVAAPLQPLPSKVKLMSTMHGGVMST